LADGPGFIHLNCHSAYSLLEGALPIGKLVKLAVQDGMPALGVTDTANLFGALEFSEEGCGGRIAADYRLQAADPVRARRGIRIATPGQRPSGETLRSGFSAVRSRDGYRALDPAGQQLLSRGDRAVRTCFRSLLLQRYLLA
jgi:hypothetical protein